MLTTPRIENILVPFDATKVNTVNFTVVSGDQVVKHEVIIQKVSDNSQVYSLVVTSFAFSHSIAANSLVNGIQYKIRIRTYNISNQVSQWSDYVVFKCLSTPITSINGLDDGVVNNQTYTFTGSYSQAENDALQSYKFILYDENQIQIGISPERFDGSISYEFTGLTNDGHYYIELKTISVSNFETSTGLVPFTVSYISPKVQNVVELENYKQNASVKINIKAIQIFFKLDSGEFAYENGEWINLKNGSIYTDTENGFNLDGDFSAKLWCKSLPLEEDFLIIYGTYGTIKMNYYNNRIHVWKEVNGLVNHYASNEINVTSDEDVIFIFCQSENDRIGIKSEILI